jgi:hypothetical protein
VKKFEVTLQRMESFQGSVFQPVTTNSSAKKRRDSSQGKISLEKESLNLQGDPAFKGDYFEAVGNAMLSAGGSDGARNKQRPSIHLSLHLCENSRGSSMHVNSERNKSPPPEMQAREPRADALSSKVLDSQAVEDRLRVASRGMEESPFQLADDASSSIARPPTDTFSEVKSRQPDEIKSSSIALDESLPRMRHSEIGEELKLNESL